MNLNSFAHSDDPSPRLSDAPWVETVASGPAAVPTLRDAEVHVWYLRLGSDLPGLTGRGCCRDWLDEEEASRAERYRHPQAREAFVRTRAYLRWLLGQYLEMAPNAIRFTLNRHGKPRLAESQEDRGLVFNVSHSGNLALLGFARDSPLGLDVEQLRPRRQLEPLADYCFSAAERKRWRKLAPEQRLAAFVRYWTVKEAFCKATGRGITLGLKNVSVAADFQGFDSVPEGLGVADAWSLHTWDIGDYRCALVSRNPAATIIHFPVEP